LSAFAEHADFDLPGDLDHYVDYGADGGWKLSLFTHHSFELTGAYRHGHDPAGLQRTEAGQPDFEQGEIDQWDQDSARLTYRFGSPESLGSNTLRGGYVQRRYTTNREQTVFLDYRIRELGYELAYEYSPKTALLVMVQQRAVDYARPVISSIGNRNGNELTLRAGVRWVASGKTSGDIQLGVRDYSIDSRSRPSRQALSWKAEVFWDPLRTTRFKLATGRTTSETFRADTLFIDERRVELGWHQQWTSRFSTDASADYSNSDFVGSARRDDTVGGRFGGDVLLTRHLKLFGQYNTRNRNSTSPVLDYDAPEAKIGLRWTL
jgi:hypothetical protein